MTLKSETECDDKITKSITNVGFVFVNGRNVSLQRKECSLQRLGG